MTIQIYVGTYAKYNNGSIEGAWIDLDDMSDADTFDETIRELHKDEVDPEFMFQDYEGFPSEFYSESGLDSRIWEYLALDDNEREIVDAFLDCFGDTQNVFEDAQNAYYGKYDKDTDFAWELLETTGDYASIPTHLQGYFDIEAYARDLMYDFSSSNDHYFTTNW
jgi:antirestriction protein